MFIPLKFGCPLVLLIVLIVGNVPKVSSQSLSQWLPRCRKSDDSMTYNRTIRDTTAPNYTNDTWIVAPSKKNNCSYHLFPRLEALAGLSDQWVIVLSGSTGMVMTVNLMTYFNPRSDAYPQSCASTDSWANCSGCNICNNQGFESWMDQVTYSNGTNLWTQVNNQDVLSGDTDTCTVPCGQNVGVNTAGLASMQSWFQQHPQPAGTFRITWVDCRFFPEVFPVVNALRSALPNVIPTIVSNIAVWYSYCGGGASYCPRSQLLTTANRNNMLYIAEQEGLYMMQNFSTHMPDLKLVLLAPSQETNTPDMGPAIDWMLANQPAAPNNIYLLMEQRNFVINDPWNQLTLWNYWLPLGQHPANIASQMYGQRLINHLVTNDPLADSSYAETFNLNGDGGCSADTAPNTADGWAQTSWHGCRFITSSLVAHGNCNGFSSCGSGFYANSSVTCHYVTCTNIECCVPNPPHCDTFSCPLGTTLKSNPGSITCVAQPCTLSECCDAIPCNADPTGPTNGGPGTCSNAITYPNSCAQTCNSGYHLTSGSLTRTCQANGSLTLTNAVCSANTCGGDGIGPAHGTAGTCSSTTTYPNTCTQTCSSGYQLTSGSLTRTCQASGSLTPTNAVCSPVTCPASSTAPNHGTAGTCSTTTTYPNTCTETCSSGYQLTSGSLTRTCQASGTLTASNAVCSAITCPASSTAPSHGTAGTCSKSPTTYPNTCTQTCNPGYHVSSGSLTRTCQASGTLTPSNAVCSH